MTRSIGLRPFLRGGYRTLDELTVVTNHGRPFATWIPHQHGEDARRAFSRPDTRTVSKNSRG